MSEWVGGGGECGWGVDGWVGGVSVCVSVSEWVWVGG